MTTSKCLLSISLAACTTSDPTEGATAVATTSTPGVISAYLGLVNQRAGRHKNAVLYLRQHLDHGGGDEAFVHARLGTAYLQLGELDHAREACNRALAIDPGIRQARWTLGRALLEEGREDEAVRREQIDARALGDRLRSGGKSGGDFDLAGQELRPPVARRLGVGGGSAARSGHSGGEREAEAVATTCRLERRVHRRLLSGSVRT